MRISCVAAYAQGQVGSHVVEKALNRFRNSPFGQGFPHSDCEVRRLVDFRLGRSLIKRRVCSGRVDCSGGSLAHQQEGACGCSQVSCQHDEAGRFCESISGLKNCSCFCKQTGGNSLCKIVQHSLGIVGAGFGQEGLDQSNLVAKGSQPSSRHVVQVGDRDLGGVFVHGGLGDDLQQVVQANHGHVCESGLSCVAKVLQLVSRQGCLHQRCIQPNEVARQMLLFSSGSSDQLDVGKDQEGQGQGHHSGSNVAHKCVVAKSTGNGSGGTIEPGLLQADSVLASGQEVAISEPSGSLSGVRSFGVSNAAKELLNADVRKSTKKIYDSRFAHFERYCADIGVHPTTCSKDFILNFLAMLTREYRYLYKTVMDYRSAISRYHIGFGGVPVGVSKNVKRIAKAIFLEVPPIPKYGAIWPASQLVDYLGTLHPPDILTTYQLGAKTLALVSLHSLSRSSTVAQLSPVYQLLGDQIVFPLMGLEKQSRPKHIRGEIRFPAGSDDQSLSTALYCQSYLLRTEERRAERAALTGSRPDRFFISNTKVIICYF